MAKILGYIVRFEGIEHLACLACAAKMRADPQVYHGVSLRPVFEAGDHPGEFCDYCDALVLRKK
jgi:hypothetical protein